MRNCYICGDAHAELHHIIKKSKMPSLKDCKMNHIYLCPKHHRSEIGVHGRDGHELDRRLRLKFQNELELYFDCRMISYETVKEILGIKDKALRQLLKTVDQKDGYYERESLIRACMGGKMEIEDN